MTDGKGPRLNTDSPLAVAGICLAIGANLIISAGLNGQKWVHNQNERLPESERKPYTKQPIWWLGLIGTILGEVLNFLAFGFAGAAIVTPLGAVCVVANEIIACAFLGEQFRIRDLFGVAATVTGSVLVVIAAPVTERDMTVSDFLRLASGAVFLTYMACVLAAMVGIYRLLPKVQHKHPAWGLTLCSLLGTLTVLCATALSNFLRLTASGRPQLGHVVPYVLLLVMVPSAIGQVRYLNETMERFDNTTVVPVYYILFTLSTVTGSAMLYQDFYDQPMANVLLFLLGCALCFGGVGLLTTGRAEHASHRPVHIDGLPAGAQGHVQLDAIDDIELPGRELDYDEESGVQRSRVRAMSADTAAGSGGSGRGGGVAGAPGHPLGVRRLSASLDGFHVATQRGLIRPHAAEAQPLQHNGLGIAPVGHSEPWAAKPARATSSTLPPLPPAPAHVNGDSPAREGHANGGRDLAASDDEDEVARRVGSGGANGNGHITHSHSAGCGDGMQQWE